MGVVSHPFHIKNFYKSTSKKKNLDGMVNNHYFAGGRVGMTYRLYLFHTSSIRY